MNKNIHNYILKGNYLLPSKDCWIVPVNILKREIYHSYVDPSKLERRWYKKRSGVYDHFQQENKSALKPQKNNMSISKCSIIIVEF